MFTEKAWCELCAFVLKTVVSAGKARYSDQSDVRMLNVSWVVPRRNSFVPELDEGIFLFLDKKDTPLHL